LFNGTLIVRNAVKINETRDSGKHDQDPRSNSTETQHSTQQIHIQHENSTSTEPSINSHGYNFNSNHNPNNNITTSYIIPTNELQQNTSNGDTNHTTSATTNNSNATPINNNNNNNTTTHGHSSGITNIVGKGPPQTHTQNAISTSTESLTSIGYHDTTKTLFHGKNKEQTKTLFHGKNKEQTNKNYYAIFQRSESQQQTINENIKNLPTPVNLSNTQGDTNTNNNIRDNNSEPNTTQQQQRTILLQDITTNPQDISKKIQQLQRTMEAINYDEDNTTTTYGKVYQTNNDKTGEHKTSLTTLTPTQNTSSYENNVPNQQNNEQISPATHITQSDIQQINFNTTQKKPIKNN
jgi:hypothetical protein